MSQDQVDLLIRLRKVECSGNGGNGTTNWYRNPDGPEAAKEIERLKGIIDTYCEVCGIASREIASLKEKIERLSGVGNGEPS